MSISLIMLLLFPFCRATFAVFSISLIDELSYSQVLLSLNGLIDVSVKILT